MSIQLMKLSIPGVIDQTDNYWFAAQAI